MMKNQALLSLVVGLPDENYKFEFDQIIISPFDKSIEAFNCKIILNGILMRNYAVGSSYNMLTCYFEPQRDKSEGDDAIENVCRYLKSVESLFSLNSNKIYYEFTTTLK